MARLQVSLVLDFSIIETNKKKPPEGAAIRHNCQFRERIFYRYWARIAAVPRGRNEEAGTSKTQRRVLTLLSGGARVRYGDVVPRFFFFSV